MASSTELRDWLAAARKEELVRRTAHWMSEAVTDPGQGYREDPGLTGQPITDALGRCRCGDGGAAPWRGAPELGLRA